MDWPWSSATDFRANYFQVARSGVRGMSKRSIWRLVGLLALAVALTRVVIIFNKPVAPPGDTGRDEPSAKADPGVKTSEGRKGNPEQESGTNRKPSGAALASGNRFAAEQAAKTWDAMVRQLAETNSAPTEERIVQVKEAFDCLGKADQMDGMRLALNLLPDEQFPCLYGILFDKSENAEILDAIFSDALNRPEEIKLPAMKILAMDKQHPMFFESARILDATGELEPKVESDEKAESPEQGHAE